MQGAECRVQGSGVRGYSRVYQDWSFITRPLYASTNLGVGFMGEIVYQNWSFILARSKTSGNRKKKPNVDDTRKVDVRLPGKGNSNSHGARSVHLIITMIKWIRTSRLSIKNSLS